MGLGAWLGRRCGPPPESGVRCVELDEAETAVVNRGDMLEVFHAPRPRPRVRAPRPEVVVFSISPRTARRLLAYLLRWWVTQAWCGLRLRLWDAARHAMLASRRAPTRRRRVRE